MTTSQQRASVEDMAEHADPQVITQRILRILLRIMNISVNPWTLEQAVEVRYRIGRQPDVHGSRKFLRQDQLIIEFIAAIG